MQWDVGKLIFRPELAFRDISESIADFRFCPDTDGKTIEHKTATCEDSDSLQFSLVLGLQSDF